MFDSIRTFWLPLLLVVAGLATTFHLEGEVTIQINLDEGIHILVDGDPDPN